MCSFFTFLWGSVDCSLQSPYCAVANQNFLPILGVTLMLINIFLPLPSSGNHYLFFLLLNKLFFQIPCVSEIVWHLSFCVWILSLNILLKMTGFYFLWLNSILLCVCTTTSLFIVVLLILNIPKIYVLKAWSPRW
jgi:hypothetical protein